MKAHADRILAVHHQKQQRHGNIKDNFNKIFFHISHHSDIIIICCLYFKNQTLK
jgi:hypothetical protein